MDVLNGASYEACSYRIIWNCLDHLNAGQAKTAVKRLQQVEDRTPTYADILTAQKYIAQEILLERFNETGWRIGTIFDPPQQSHSRQPMLFGVLTIRIKNQHISLVLRSKQWVYDSYMNRLDRLIGHIPPKYQKRIAEPPPETYDRIGVLLQPIYDSLDFKVTISQTQNRMLLVGCALQAYRADQGAYPPTLQALTPHYLAQLPDDPFAISGSFHYRRKGSNYLLYSIGPDGKDDGGMPAHNERDPTSSYIDGGSTGDIVAGVDY